MMNSDSSTPTLGTQNRVVLARYIAPLPKEVRAKALQTLQSEYESTVAPNAPEPGAIAPDFTLQSYTGEQVSLSSVGAPVVLSFFRGGWCPYCTSALKALQRRLPAITVHGGIVYGISPEPATDSKHTARRNQIRFPLLIDTDNTVADQYGLRSSIAPLLAPLYEMYSVPWPEDCARLDVPYPATFIIDADRKVVSAFVEQDPSKRMSPHDIASIIRGLKPA